MDLTVKAKLNRCRRSTLALLVSALMGALPAGAAPLAYQPAGMCGDFPALPLKVAPGFCVGLAATGLGMPRGVLPLDDGRILVTDMGEWNRGHGRLLKLTREEGSFRVEVLLTGLNRPHSLQRGPDGTLYLGEDNQISTLTLDPTGKAHLTPVVQGLPDTGLHPLKSFVVGSDQSLFVNEGAPTNNCENHIDDSQPVNKSCLEAEGPDAQGAVWKFQKDGNAWHGQVYATGLRNSVAMYFDSKTGKLWEADNARDALPLPAGVSDEDLPHDSLNLIKAGQRYEWPYCYDKGVSSPEFPKASCVGFQLPYTLLPGHAAPLGLAVYDNVKAPAGWRHMLLMTYHGYRAHGHRIVGFQLDRRGTPGRASRDLVAGWEGRAHKEPMGAPTDIKVDEKGSIWVTEDHNGTLLVILPSKPQTTEQTKAR